MFDSILNGLGIFHLADIYKTNKSIKFCIQLHKNAVLLEKRGYDQLKFLEMKGPYFRTVS